MPKGSANLFPYVTVVEQGSTPSTPAAGTALVYRKTDDKLYILDDGGVETEISQSGVTSTAAGDVTITDAGGYLTATDVEAALQEAMAEVDANTAASHAEDHASRHSDGGADEITVENLATASVNTAHALKPDGLGGVEFGAVSAVGAIDDLSDVDTDKSKTPADGDVLTYDGTDWNAEAASGGGASAIDDLSDVDTDKSKTPADGDVLTFDGTDWNAESLGAVSGDDLELDYTEITSSVNITATSEATATTLVTAAAVTFDGNTEVIIEFSANMARPEGGNNIFFWLYEDGSSIGRLGYLLSTSQDGGPVHLTRRLTPSAASHTYSVRAHMDTSNGTVSAGAGGSGNGVPA